MSLSDLFKNLNYSHFSRTLEKSFPLQSSNQGSYRMLTAAEIERLKGNGNYCADWESIRVSQPFIPDHIHQSRFSGSCTLGYFDGSVIKAFDGCGYVRGIWSSTLNDSHVADGAVVQNCEMIASAMIGEHAIVSHSHVAATQACATFGNGRWIFVGIETGGRTVPVFTDLSLELAELILTNPGDKDMRRQVEDFLSTYCSMIQRPTCIVGEHAAILGCRSVRDSYIGPYTQIFQASAIDNSTIDSNPEDPVHIGVGAIIRDSIVQEGCSVKDAAIIESSMLFEHSHASHHGVVIDCLVGPNSGVSKGEATSSFLGPFVGFHHQSLLIAAVWPRGRGNVAYGANVGSNHTSRVPDQEFWPGEGMFFGLACSIKYPANFREAPYTIIAAGVTTLPQRMSFPFSLVNEPVAYYLEVAPGLQNLIPAWCLTENFYALMRNEGKYKVRNRAKRNKFDLNLFRPEILAYMESARNRLMNIKMQKSVYLPGDIEGIGKNMMTDENRIKAIEAYSFFLELAEHRKQRDSLSQQMNVSKASTQSAGDPVKSLLRLKDMLPSLVSRTRGSRARDYERGCEIIDDYAKTHVTVDKDSFVLEVEQQIRTELAEIDGLISRYSE